MSIFSSFGVRLSNGTVVFKSLKVFLCAMQASFSGNAGGSRPQFFNCQPKKVGTDWVSIYESCRQAHVARLAFKHKLSQEELAWVDDKSRLKIGDLEKCLCQLNLEINLGTDKVRQAALERNKLLIEELISLKRRPKKRKSPLEQRSTSWTFSPPEKKLKTYSIESKPEPSRLFHKFFYSNVSHPRDFSHPESNYGQVLAALEQFDRDAIPCLQAFTGCAPNCNRKHIDWQMCENVYIDWVTFLARYEQLAGEKHVPPKQSIVNLMYRNEWKK